MSDDWTDEEFLDYVDLHSRTDLHLFSKEHARRLAKLSGAHVYEPLPEFVHINQWNATKLIAAAKERIAAESKCGPIDE